MVVGCAQYPLSRLKSTAASEVLVDVGRRGRWQAVLMALGSLVARSSLLQQAVQQRGQAAGLCGFRLLASATIWGISSWTWERCIEPACHWPEQVEAGNEAAPWSNRKDQGGWWETWKVDGGACSVKMGTQHFMALGTKALESVSWFNGGEDTGDSPAYTWPNELLDLMVQVSSSKRCLLNRNVQRNLFCSLLCLIHFSREIMIRFRGGKLSHAVMRRPLEVA